jgi:hypothetical protein
VKRNTYQLDRLRRTYGKLLAFQVCLLLPVTLYRACTPTLAPTAQPARTLNKPWEGSPSDRVVIDLAEGTTAPQQQEIRAASSRGQLPAPQKRTESGSEETISVLRRRVDQLLTQQNGTE